MITNATFYISDPSMLGSRLFKSLDQVKGYASKSEDDTATGFELSFDWGVAVFSMMQASELDGHLAAFRGYGLAHLACAVSEPYFLTRLSNVRMVLGCKIAHDEADIDGVVEFVYELNASLNGLLFFFQSIVDWNGEALSGPLASKDESQ